MTVPAAQAVSYLPGRWTALVVPGLCLLADVPLVDPVLARCWTAAEFGPDAVLQILAGSTRDFVLVARDDAGLRLVVGGTARAEVFAGTDDPVVYGPTSGNGTRHNDSSGSGSTDVRLDAALDVRLVADDATPFERLAPLPLRAGVVLASYVFDLAETQAATADGVAQPVTDDAVGWIPPPLADEPAPQLSGVFRALPWRASFPETDATADEGSGGVDEVAARSDEGLAAASGSSRDDASGGDASGVDVSGVDVSGVDAEPGPPLVQAVTCANGHLNPVHADACRVCGAGIAAQQPVTVQRPPLGMLRLPTGAVVVLDRDALLGRAPFAVDRSVQLVELASPANDISRSHVRITLDGWQVFVTDLASTNGTAVTVPGYTPMLLRPHEPFALTSGAVLSLADEAEVRFDVV